VQLTFLVGEFLVFLEILLFLPSFPAVFLKEIGLEQMFNFKKGGKK